MSTPIIPWMGGKRRQADRLIPLFPTHECYVEVLNYINGDLVTLYRVVQNHLEELVWVGA